MAHLIARSPVMGAARTFFLLAALLLLQGCVRLTLAWAPNTPRGEAAAPPVLEGIETVAAWEQRRSLIKEVLQREIYGFLPTDQRTEVVAHRMADDDAMDGIGRYEEFDMLVTPLFEGTAAPEPVPLTMTVVSPQDAEGPVPVIMTETFCPRTSAISRPNVPGEGDEMPGMVRYVFGRYICEPPLDMILEAGFALAMVAATDVVPDQDEAGLEALTRLSGKNEDDPARWGAIAAWGWVFSRMADVLSDEPRFDSGRLFSYGHSRYGKAALFAAAFDERIAAAIGHQSGTGGASLNRKKVGESIKAITGSFPHWFAPTYRSYAGNAGALTYDQHHLLALIAPRPVLLGNARRDVWSDPNGAFKAARGAAPVYGLYGMPVPKLERLDTFRPDDPLSFWMRPGTHGVVEEDWPAFLAFLKAHFAPEDRRAKLPISEGFPPYRDGSLGVSGDLRVGATGGERLTHGR